MAFLVFQSKKEIYLKSLDLSSRNPKNNLGNRKTLSRTCCINQTEVNKFSDQAICAVQIVYDLNSSCLKDMQQERKFRIKKVCEMCHHDNMSSMDCNHLTLNEDYRLYKDYARKFYNTLLVDDKHKVRTLAIRKLVGTAPEVNIME